MASPPSVKNLQNVRKALEQAMDDLQRKSLVPLLKESFLCSAKCCDAHQDMQQIQQCTMNCQQKVQAAQQVLYGDLEDFQRRFQRCLMRCDDQAKDSLPSNPKDKDISRAQAMASACMEACAAEYVGKVPKLTKDITASLQKLSR